VILYKRAKKVVVRGEKDFAFTLDGEIIRKPVLELEVEKNALKFAVPNNI
jgi:diacylglycerol kinase family enzyme